MCGNPGTLLHVLWDCPLVVKYWHEIFQTIANVIGLSLPMEPGMALLSLGVEILSPDKRTIAIHILLSARLVLARHWKQVNPPPLQEVITTTHTHATCELLFASMQNSLHKIRPLWQLWLDWYERHKFL